MASSLRCAALLSLIAVGFWLPIQFPQAHASGPLALDGVGTSTICGTYCRAESLTTAHGHDVIILIVENARAIFDQSPRFPITLSCLGPGGISVTTCSASIGAVDHDFIIASTAINDAGACTPSSGFAELGGDGGDGVLDIDYQVVSMPQGNLVFTCSGSDPVAMVADAISLPNAFGTS